MKAYTQISPVVSLALALTLGTALAQDVPPDEVPSLDAILSEMESPADVKKEMAMPEMVSATPEAKAPKAEMAAPEPVPAPAPEPQTVEDARASEDVAAAIAAKDKAWMQRDEALKMRDEALAQRDAALKSRDDAALESAEKIRMLEETVADLQAKVDTLIGQVQIKDGELNEMQMAVAATQKSTLKEKLALAYNLGCIYKAGRQFQKAEAQFLEALDYAPDDPAVHYNLGILYDDNLEDTAKARKHYERFLELAPNDADAPKVIQWLKELM